jgi:hypothetical protein
MSSKSQGEENMSADLNEPELMVRFLEGLKQAAGAAGAMAHSQQRPAWLDVRAILERVRESGAIMAASKAMTRQEVLKDLEQRKKNIRVN